MWLYYKCGSSNIPALVFGWMVGLFSLTFYPEVEFLGQRVGTWD